ALDPALRVGADRHDVAAVPQRDDWLLEGAAELGGDERVEAALEPVERDPDGGTQAAQAWRRGVEQLPRRIERAGEGRRDRGQRMEAPAQLPEQRPARVGQVRLERGGGVERHPDIEELLR